MTVVGRLSFANFVTLNLFQGPFLGTLCVMINERSPCVYILASQPHGTLYIGVTSNLISRLWQHRNGEIDRFTKRHAVHRLVRYEAFGDMERAINREKQLKNWRRQWKINLILSENPDWHDLAVGLGVAPIEQSGRQDGS